MSTGQIRQKIKDIDPSLILNVPALVLLFASWFRGLTPVFDALSSARVYKPAFPFEKAMQIIKDGSGTQFDPKCVEVFIESSAEVRKVLKRYQEIQ